MLILAAPVTAILMILIYDFDFEGNLAKLGNLGNLGQCINFLISFILEFASGSSNEPVPGFEFAVVKSLLFCRFC